MVLEWSFSATAEQVVAALLVVTLIVTALA